MDILQKALNDSLAQALILSGLAFFLAMALTPVYTFVAYRYKFWKRQPKASTATEDQNIVAKLHANKFKRNIPTMAGAVFVIAIAVVTLLFNLNRQETWLPLAALVGGALVGLIDDIINIRGDGKAVTGLRSSLKFIMITGIGLLLGWYFFGRLDVTAVTIPFIGVWDLGWLIVPLFALVVVSVGSAVNLSDGLDGLAGGLAAIAFGSFGVIAIIQGNPLLAGFCVTVVGALLSYIWFNIYPARFFMGDVGSFALGTSLGVVVMLTDSLFILPIIGFVFVLEAGSSLIQIIGKKVFKRRVFIAAPIHRHLEATGWPETKVTMRFWVIAAVTSFIGVMVAIAGGNI